MSTALAKSSTVILAIPLSDPELLFEREDGLQDIYRQLMKRWHPDLNKDPKAPDVASHITALYRAAEKKIEAGRWVVPGLLSLRGIDKVTRKVPFRVRRQFEIGEMFYGPKTAAFMLKTEYADLFHNANKTLGRIKYPSQRFIDKLQRYIPHAITAAQHPSAILASFETVDGHCVLVIRKTPDVFLLQDVIDHFGGRLEPKHVAWVINRFYDMLCLLEFNKLTHNAISPETVFVSGEHHGTLLLGGWWYVKEAGSRMDALPPLARSLATPDMLKSKTADPAVDLRMIRALGRSMLGDITGMTFPLRKDIPKPMADFLRGPVSGSARIDFADWERVLSASFGDRSFAKMELNPNDIFKGEPNG